MKRKQFLWGLLQRPPTLLAFLLSFGLLSCEKKDETSKIEPAPVLKSIRTISESPDATFSFKQIKRQLSLEYVNDVLSKVTSKDTVFLTDGKLEIYPQLVGTLTNTAVDEYKLISDAFAGTKIYPLESTAKKVSGMFELNIQVGAANSYTLLTLEENANKQATKIVAVKTVTTGANGVKKETPIGYSQRWEYDANGNANKVYYKISSTDKEYLALENTYDNNPNPLKVMSWYYRLSGTASENNNNILTTKQYNPDGKLISEQTTVYTYDTHKYPLTATLTGKSYDVGSFFGKTITYYQY